MNDKEVLETLCLVQSRLIEAWSLYLVGNYEKAAGEISLMRDVLDDIYDRLDEVLKE